MTIHYNKLVRDQIPEMIEKEGFYPLTRILDDEEYTAALMEKLSEEVQEYLTDKNSEELADILEVVFALAKSGGLSEEQLSAVRLEKKKMRGGFEKRLYLVSKTDE